MQNNNRRTIQRFLALGAAIFSIGVALSALVTKDKTWVSKSISDLGIDTNSWFLFNGTMVLTGLAFIPVVRELQKVLHHNLLAPEMPGAFPYFRYIIKSLTLVPFAIMGIGFVPYTVNVHLHNSFALVILLVFSANCLAFSLKQKTNQQRTRRISALIAVLIGIATMTYISKRLGYVEYEFLLFALMVVWAYQVSTIQSSGEVVNGW